MKNTHIYLLIVFSSLFYGSLWVIFPVAIQPSVRREVLIVNTREDNRSRSELMPVVSEKSHVNNTIFPVILCFPFLHELDLLHVKLVDLADYVTLFVLCESPYDDRGNNKKLIYEQYKHEERFHVFNKQIVHLIDNFVPQRSGFELGWGMNKRMKQCIGEHILHTIGKQYPSAIVVFGDADEIPSRESVRWLGEHGCESGVTYEFASTMPAYEYGFRWLAHANGYSTMTARSMVDEMRFWSMAQIGGSFVQELRALPIAVSGFHCSYCMVSELCVEKLSHTNLGDGPPFLGLYNWTVDVFDALRICGIAPQGRDLVRETELKHEWVVNMYGYMWETRKCTDAMRNRVRQWLRDTVG